MSVTRLSATLTQVLAPTTYTSVSNPIFGRVAGGSVLLAVGGSGTVRVYNAKDGYTPTWNLSYSNQPNAFDNNLSTYASYTVPANTAETDALTVDFSASAERYILVRLRSSDIYLWHRVYISSDGTTWTKVVETKTTSATSFIIKETFRYARITVENVNPTYSMISEIYEVAAFAIASAFFTRTVSYSDRVVIDEIQPNPYWVWVEPSSSLTVSIFERVLPSSASEVWIL